MTQDKPRSINQSPNPESRVSELTFLHETSKLLTATLDLDTVLRSLMTQVRKYFQVEAVSVALLDEEKEQLTFRVAVGEAADEVIGMQMEPGQGIAGSVVQSGEPVVVSDVQANGRFFEGIDEITGFQTQKILAVPIQTGHRTIGVIEAINPEAGTFDEKAVDLLCEVAERAAAAIRNAELYERARQAEHRYESLFHGSPVPIIVMDPTGNVLDLNQEAVHLLERPIDGLIGSSCSDLFGRHWPSYKEDFNELRETEQVRTEIKVPTQTGLRVLEVHMTTINYGGEQAVQWIGHDITEQVELERMRDDLLHMIVHDLRNPLGIILGSLQMMRTAFAEKDETFPMIDTLQVAVRSSKKLRRLVDSLLDLRQLEEGKAELDRKLVSPKLLAQEAVESVKPTADKKRQELSMQIPPELPSIYVDQDMITRVLINLLDNAAKFTPSEGELRISIDQKETGMLFTVSDTGPGIPPEAQEQIFDRFTRMENTKESKGIGLGLSFCKLAVEAHGGSLWVESEPGEGSDFKFTLPLEVQ